MNTQITNLLYRYKTIKVRDKIINFDRMSENYYALIHSNQTFT